ncbi:MAG: TetR/AcrR family transcriptional regulator [Synergistaceae bacterium]|nr:TetR/AcrR family transcriptional regulator [Synergistaceae bacterium]
MDRRQKKTRAAIFEAFGKLLSSKSYSKITVQEIIDAANVGRATFYAHFETKDFLLKEMCADLFEHVFSAAPTAESSHDFSLAGGEPRAIITHILYHLRDSDKNIIGILSCESGELFLCFFRQYLRELTAAYLLSAASCKNAEIPLDFLINHVSCGFVGMIQWWIKNNLKETPEELAGYFMSVIAPAIRSGEEVREPDAGEEGTTCI